LESEPESAIGPTTVVLDGDGSAISERDLELIQSLRWLCFDQQQQLMAMQYINGSLRNFLCMYSIDQQ
jgi:hypothetical protein